MKKYASIFFLFAFLGITVFGNFAVLENAEMSHNDICMTVMDQKISCPKDTSPLIITPAVYTPLFTNNSYDLEKKTSNPDVKENYMAMWLALHENSPTVS